jgi:hypothetical protein
VNFFFSDDKNPCILTTDVDLFYKTYLWSDFFSQTITTIYIIYIYMLKPFLDLIPFNDTSQTVVQKGVTKSEVFLSLYLI